MSAPAWDRWSDARPVPQVLHLDHAAVGRSSVATLTAAAEHARLEAVVGGYVAQDQAGEALRALRRDTGELLGTDAHGVAFTESAIAALAALLESWPLERGATIACVPAGWGPVLEVVRHHGFMVELLAVDDDGVLDLERFEQVLATSPPAVVLLDQVAAHRGLVQPVDEAVAIARRHGVPVWVDAAQTVGHLPVAAADAVFGTSRKWLGGPRGVGMLAVAAPSRSALRVRRPAKSPDLPVVHCLESEEAHVAGRIGLGVAVREHLDLGPALVGARLTEIGRQTRAAVETLDGWQVLRPDAPAGAVTALVATAGQDVELTRRRLLAEDRILTTVCLPWRAPADPTLSGSGPLLRLSPHVGLTGDDLERVCVALSRR